MDRQGYNGEGGFKAWKSRMSTDKHEKALLLVDLEYPCRPSSWPPHLTTPSQPDDGREKDLGQQLSSESASSELWHIRSAVVAAAWRANAGVSS